MSQDLVKTDIEWLSPENNKIIRSQFFPPNASDAEMQYCIGVAKAFNLNPILKQIYFVPRRSKVNDQWIEKIEPLAGRDSFLTLAHRSGKFDGIESKILCLTLFSPLLPLFQALSLHVPVSIPLPNTHRSCSAYQKHHHGSADRPGNDKRNPMPHPVKVPAV
mgnify:CR=1 FL=1